MGRHSYSERGTTEAARRIELPWLKKNGHLSKDRNLSWSTIQWSCNGEPSGNISFRINSESTSPYMQLMYRAKDHRALEDEWNDHDHSIDLEKISCNFGGYKWFFRCKLYKNSVFCGKRARVLYMVNGLFGCRQCANLSYESCNEGKRFRWLFKFVAQEDKEMKLFQSLRRFYYRGKPTKRYARYLRLVSSEESRVKALKVLNEHLERRR